jgi:hypothetical protein
MWGVVIMMELNEPMTSLAKISEHYAIVVTWH